MVDIYFVVYDINKIKKANIIPIEFLHPLQLHFVIVEAQIASRIEKTVEKNLKHSPSDHEAVLTIVMKIRKKSSKLKR